MVVGDRQRVWLGGVSRVQLRESQYDEYWEAAPLCGSREGSEPFAVRFAIPGLIEVIDSRILDPSTGIDGGYAKVDIYHGLGGLEVYLSTAGPGTGSTKLTIGLLGLGEESDRDDEQVLAYQLAGNDARRAFVKISV